MIRSETFEGDDTFVAMADYGSIRASGGVDASGRLTPDSVIIVSDNAPPIAVVKFANMERGENQSPK